MKKNITINTVTANALAGQIINTINTTKQSERKAIIDKVKSDSLFKALIAAKKTEKEAEKRVIELEKQIEGKYKVDINTYNSEISVDVPQKRLETTADKGNLMDEIIVLFNIERKSFTEITKKLVEKYS